MNFFYLNCHPATLPLICVRKGIIWPNFHDKHIHVLTNLIKFLTLDPISSHFRLSPNHILVAGLPETHTSNSPENLYMHFFPGALSKILQKKVTMTNSLIFSFNHVRYLRCTISILISLWLKLSHSMHQDLYPRDWSFLWACILCIITVKVLASLYSINAKLRIHHQSLKKNS